MVLLTFKKCFGASVALVLLMAALVGYLPTSHCHCRDAKPDKVQKVACPFGQLRSLALSLLTDPVREILVVFSVTPVSESYFYKTLYGIRPVLAFDAQAPPLLY